MKKYNTVIIRDESCFYVGEIGHTPERKITRLTGFKPINSEQIKKEFSSLKYNQFYIVEIIEYVAGLAITPKKLGELVDDKGKNINFYQMNNKEILKVLNKKIPHKFLKVKET